MRRMIGVAVLAAVAPVLGGQATDPSRQPEVEAKNEKVVRDATEAMNRGDLKAYVSYWAEDTKNFDRAVGREGIRQAIEDIFTTFPDYRHDLIEVIARGDSVVVRCTAGGTHRGVGKMKLNGGMLVGVPATQKHFAVQHIHWYTLRDGKIVAHTANRDDLGMMRQLGLLPAEGLPKCASD
jgi:predicted ester cyclase